MRYGILISPYLAINIAYALLTYIVAFVLVMEMSEYRGGNKKNILEIF